jgi:hypothetical protein
MFSKPLTCHFVIKEMMTNVFKVFFGCLLFIRLILNLFTCSHGIIWILLYRLIQKFQQQFKLPHKIWNIKHWLWCEMIVLLWIHPFQHFFSSNPKMPLIYGLTNNLWSMSFLTPTKFSSNLSWCEICCQNKNQGSLTQIVDKFLCQTNDSLSW